MAKKSKDADNSSSADAVQSLFSLDNPFRRKPEPPRPPPPPPPEPELVPDNGRKRKPDKDPDLIPEKHKAKPEIADEGVKESRRQKNRKQKREEVEEYERRKLGASGDAAEKKKGDKGKAAAVEQKKKDADLVPETKDSKEEAFDDDEKLLRTVFVGNLPVKMKKKALMKEFRRFGEIESLRIRSVPLVPSKIPRKGAIIKGKINEAVDSVHAYIVFKDEQSVRAALSHNMAEVGGNHIRVDMACPPRKKMEGTNPMYDRKRTVFVGNLPFDVKDEELYTLFSSTSLSGSSLEAVRVVRDPNTSLGKGIAYVLFKTRDAANSVVKQRDMKIRDRVLRLCHAKSEATPLKPLSKTKTPKPKPDFSRRKPASNSWEASPGSKDKPKAKAASLSYQGIRASKYGAPKKSRLRPHSEVHAKRGSNSSGRPEQKTPKAKRPAVAARKEKFKKEMGTREMTRPSKKARKK